MTTELIPVVDLRVLSQSELATLALSSPNAFDLRRCDDVVVPKIDRSVFNESAGSRKQTYSRLRLAPPKTDSLSPSIPRRRGRPRSIPLRTTAAASATNSAAPSNQPQNDPDHRENLLVASFLRRLFSRDDPSSQTLTPDKAASSVSANETNEGWRNILAAAEEAQKALVLAEDVDRERLTPKGVAVDLALLGQMEEPFGEEMRRKTHGLTTEGQLLGFLSGLEGQWGSRRKRRKFVDASLFGDVLPGGWKLLLGLKRKEGVAWLDCRRYVSPKGYQFVSCKEVSSYILSLQGSMQPVSNRDDDNIHSSDKVTNDSNVGQVHQSIISNRSSSFSSATPVSYLSGNHEKQAEATTFYYATPISYIYCETEKQQLFSSHQRSAKRRRRGKMIVDGVILKDGKYECQFCHKTFSERHRYTGHIGAHVRYQGLTAETLLDETSTTKSTDQSSWAIVPYTSSENDVSAMKIDERRTIQCATEEHGASTTGNHAEIFIAKSCDDFHTEGIVEEEIAMGIKCNDCIDRKFHSACDMNTTSQKYSPMIHREVSASKSVDNDVKDCDMTSSNMKGDNDAKFFEEVKHSVFSYSVPLLSTHPNKDIPKAPDVSAFSSSISNSVNMLPVSTDVEDALCKMNDGIDAPSSSMNKPKDADSPFLTMDAACCHADEVVSFIPMSKSVDDTSLDAACVDNIADETINEINLSSSPNKSDVHNKSDGNSIKHNSQNVDDTGKYMDVDTDLCYDLSLSLMDVDVKSNDKHNEINRPSSRLTSEFEKYNEKLIVEAQNHLITFSGNRSGITYDTYAKDISTHAVDGQDDSECCHSFSDKDAILIGSMHDTLQASSTVAPFSDEQTMDIEANTDCPFRTDINESVLEEIDKPVNVLEFFFSGNNTVHEGNAADEMIGNADASKALHINLANSSWIRGTNVLPVLDMLPDQGDEIALRRAANIVFTNKDQYVAVLFYASWCPFSKKCLPNFNLMTSLFPSIPHFAFEESVIRPSVLSRYGVHGFPTLFLLHSSMRVRYLGSRSISSLTFFYSNVTGLKPASLDPTALKKALIVTNVTEHTPGQENCPFSWARSPEKLLQQDTYLALAASFVILRLLYLLWPKLTACLKIAWRRQSRFASLVSLWGYFQAFLQQSKRGFSRLNPSKRSNLQGGAISAKAWASKSLASVSFGEPKSSILQ